MSPWNRQTPWRQGHALDDVSALALGFIGEEQRPTAVVVVISHDCDLAKEPEIEPEIEVIIGRRVPAPNGNLTHAKNPRKLHLLCSENESEVCLELEAKAKRCVMKANLDGHLPNQVITITPGNRSILQQWLAARYRRSGFPDDFESRLDATRVDRRIEKILKNLGANLVGVFFEVDNDEEIDRRGTEEPYELRIYLLYCTQHDPARAKAEATEAAEKISLAFNNCRLPGSDWDAIELVSCEAISDEVMPYAASVRMKKWNCEYLSLRDDPENAPMLLE